MTKDGAQRNHKVIDKLARYKGDNLRALATVHLSEALLTSQNETTTDEHNHQWMDEKGWTLRAVYLQDKAGNIYSAVLNIANGKERKILYDINLIQKIDEKRGTAGGAVPSAVSGGARSTSHSSSEDRVTQTDAGSQELFSGSRGKNQQDFYSLEPDVEPDSGNATQVRSSILFDDSQSAPESYWWQIDYKGKRRGVEAADVAEAYRKVAKALGVDFKEAGGKGSACDYQ